MPLCSICFDDLERVADTINLNDLFGAVNELVENVKHLVAEKRHNSCAYGIKCLFLQTKSQDRRNELWHQTRHNT